MWDLSSFWLFLSNFLWFRIAIFQSVWQNQGISSWHYRYVHGISITRGSPREHIWTLASALDEIGTVPRSNCPCINSSSSGATPPPAFVGRDYFCDTGSELRFRNRFYGDDPLWDGAGCGPLNSCCSLNNPPWFYKQLPQLTTDVIEMRACRSQTTEDIASETVEI